MPYSKLLVHIVWATKNRSPFLKDDVRHLIQQHILSNAKKKEIFIEIINGHLNHMHCLISLGNDQKLSDVIRLIKGESSFWVNKQKLISERFCWQDEYYAISVSPSNRDIVINYIKNQEKHHRRVSLQEEYDEFIEKFNIKGLG